MWREDNILHRSKRMCAARGLAFHYIQRRSRDPSLGQRFVQRLFVDQFPPRGIDQIGATLHLLQSFVVDDMSRLGGKR